jgi:predicted DNA-binding transcriptional regulator YafY
VLDDEETVALAIDLRAAVQGAVAGIEESLIRALTKVTQVMPSRLRRRVDALPVATVPAVWGAGPTIDAGTLTTVAQACRDEERMRFSYTARGGQRTQRHVEPHRLVSLGRRYPRVGRSLHPRHDGMRERMRRL